MKLPFISSPLPSNRSHRRVRDAVRSAPRSLGCACARARSRARDRHCRGVAKTPHGIGLAAASHFPSFLHRWLLVAGRPSIRLYACDAARAACCPGLLSFIRSADCEYVRAVCRSSPLWSPLRIIDGRRAVCSLVTSATYRRVLQGERGEERIVGEFQMSQMSEAARERAAS